MPLIDVDSETALASLKGNAAAMWPRRGEPNRLSPIARPRLNPNFVLEPGEKIFTIGSCFARNVERELAAQGFVLPALDAIAADEDFAAVGSGVLNNYGTPSIYNEIHWALEQDYEERETFFPLAGKWVDMHLHTHLRPKPIEVVRARRAAIVEAYRQIQECRVIVITLGLAEVWLDTETGIYLNTPPRRGMLREAPDRFRLQILSFEEAAGYLRKAMELIRRHGREDVRVVLTVSPVPLTATYRPIDVMEANCYSKAVLRVVAEHVRSEFDFIDYYPSFESVTLSERSVAWQEDEVHVTPDVVAVNIDRMVEAYSSRKELSLDTIRDLIQSERPQKLFKLLAKYPEYFDHGDVAAAYVNAAIRTNNVDEAAKWLHKADDPSGLFTAHIALLNGDPHKALASLNEPPGDNRLTGQYYGVTMGANLQLGKFAEAEKALHAWTKRSPKSHEPYRMMGEYTAKVDLEAGRKWYARAYDIAENLPRITIEYAEILLALGEVEEAKALTKNVKGVTPNMERRLEKVRSAIELPG